jgi:hypothetical protein
MQVLKREMEPT